MGSNTRGLDAREVLALEGAREIASLLVRIRDFDYVGKPGVLQRVAFAREGLAILDRTWFTTRLAPSCYAMEMAREFFQILEVQQRGVEWAVETAPWGVEEIELAYATLIIHRDFVAPFLYRILSEGTVRRGPAAFIQAGLQLQHCLELDPQLQITRPGLVGLMAGRYERHLEMLEEILSSLVLLQCGGGHV